MTDTAHITKDSHSDWAWPPTFALVAVAGSLFAACMMPFVAVATVAAGTLDLRRGLLSVIAVWVANQIIGFGLLGFPLNLPTIMSGVALCISTLIAFFVARSVLGRGTATLAYYVVAGVAGFAAYEASLFGMAHLYGGTGAFTPAIIALIGTNEALWFAGLLTGHALLTRLAPAQFGAPRALRFA